MAIRVAASSLSSGKSTVICQVINSQRVVCPTREELQVEHDEHVCPSEGCCKVFKTSSQLQMHMTRHHQIQQRKSTCTSANSGILSRDCVFYCPVEGCPRSKVNSQPFPRLGQLKQHYHTVHGSKEYCCQKCGKAFGLRDVCSRHEAECGKDFTCETCGDKFRTKNAHYKHAVRKRHALPVGSKPKNTQMNPSKPVLRPPTIIVKNVVQLPPKRVSTTAQTRLTGLSANKETSAPETNNTAVQVDLLLKNLIEGNSSASQTNESYLSVHDHYDYINRDMTSSEKSNTSVGATPSLCNLCSEEEDNPLNLELIDFATQTDLEEFSLAPSHFNLATQTEPIVNTSTVGTQQGQSTIPFPLCDFATQTEIHSLTPTHFNFATQTEPPSATTLTPLHFNLGTQTEPVTGVTTLMHEQHDGYADPLSLCDLATQTNNKDLGRVTSDFSLNDFATQTSEEDIRRIADDLCGPLTPTGSTDHNTAPSQCGNPVNSSLSSQSQAIQTLPLLTSELGTQTLNFYHLLSSTGVSQFSPPVTDLSSIAEQSLSYHRSSNELGEIVGSAAAESAVDFGTQTTLQFPLTLSSVSINGGVNNFGTQTMISDKELSELVSELSSDALQHILPPECMDFGTQTQESGLDGIEYLDFGVQTSLGLEFLAEQQDQSSQTHN